MKPYHFLFLFSDTGGGHRSAAEAIIEALNLEFDGQVTTEMVDVFKQYAPNPINRAPKVYPMMVRIPELWGLGYHLSNGKRRVGFINASVWPYVRRSMCNLVARHPSDIIVSVHPLVNEPMLRALRQRRVPYVTVVTDLVTAHAFWYNPKIDLTIVPTEEARQLALSYGLDPAKVIVIGLPVAERFCQPHTDKIEARRQLGLPLERPLVLLVGGGDGMGPIEPTARAIAEANLPINLVIVTGRNVKLKERLEGYHWEIPTFIYGFVRQMPLFMQAADILVTKAGPGTICEALNAGLPMALYSRLPGQEEGNIDYVCKNGAGVWAPRPEIIVAALRNWVENPALYAQAVEACHRMARPQAARQIARILFEICSQPEKTLCTQSISPSI